MNKLLNLANCALHGVFPATLQFFGRLGSRFGVLFSEVWPKRRFYTSTFSRRIPRNVLLLWRKDKIEAETIFPRVTLQILVSGLPSKNSWICTWPLLWQHRNLQIYRRKQSNPRNTKSEAILSQASQRCLLIRRGPRILVWGARGVLTPEGGPEPKNVLQIGVLPWNCLKTAWF